MSQNISSTLPAINHNDQNHSLHNSGRKQHKFSSEVEGHQKYQSDTYRKGNEDISSKAFNSLTNSLERAFSDAVKVDKKTGEEEISQGGLQRVAKDLQKLFKGMGFSPQQAKQYARDISSAMGQDSVEQIDFSLSATSSLTVSGYNQSGESAAVLTEENNTATQPAGFQLTAVQTRSFDVSINLTTGEFSINRSSEENITLSALSPSTTAEEEVLTDQLQSLEEPQDQSPIPGDVATEENVQENEATAALTAEEDTETTPESILFQFSRTIQQSAIFSQQAATGVEAEEETEADLDASGNLFSQLQQFAESQLQVNFGDTNLFESMTNITNLRVENIDHQKYLSFSVQATAPAALTVVDDDGGTATIYPRPDGSTGEITTESIEVTA